MPYLRGMAIRFGELGVFGPNWAGHTLNHKSLFEAFDLKKPPKTKPNGDFLYVINKLIGGPCRARTYDLVIKSNKFIYTKTLEISYFSHLSAVISNITLLYDRR
jgi:hypothetical protein